MLSFDVSECRFYGTAGQPGEFPNGKHVDFLLNEDGAVSTGTGRSCCSATRRYHIPSLRG